MNLQAFAREIVLAADKGLVTLLPISSKDKRDGCIIRFALGTLYA